MRKNIKKYLPILLLIITTLLVGFPLFKNKMLNGHDAVFQLFRCYSTKVAMKDGQLIPMINPNMIGGFGYGVNMFYGAFITYIVTFLSILIKPIGLSINIVILIIIFLSGLFMYLFIKDVSNDKKSSLIAGIIYMTAPYFLYDIYVRMALGEIISFVFLPLLFHGLYNIVHQDRKKWYLLTIGMAGLFLSHTVSTFMAAIFAFIYVLFNMKKVLKKDTMKKLLLSLILGLILSLPIILPLLEAKLSSDYMVFDNVYMKTTGVKMESRAIHLFTSNDFLSNIVKGYLVIMIGILIFYMIKRNKEEHLKMQYQFLFLILFSLLLTLSFIPWSNLPSILSTLQFPWRFLMMSSFFLAITISLLYEQLFSKKRMGHIIILMIVCTLSVIPLLKSGIENKGVDNQLINSNSLKKRGDIVRSTGSASAEYLPRNAIYQYDYLSNHSKAPVIVNGKGNIENVKKEGTHLSFQIEVENLSIIEFPYIYYPGYVVKGNKENIRTFETKKGLLGIKLEKGIYRITSHYRGTGLMIFAYTSFVIAFIALIVIIMIERCASSVFNI